MPIYEYRCQDCDTAFELFVRSLNSAVEAVCPQCHSEHVRKAVSSVSATGMAVAGAAAGGGNCAPSG